MTDAASRALSPQWASARHRRLSIPPEQLLRAAAALVVALGPHRVESAASSDWRTFFSLVQWAGRWTIASGHRPPSPRIENGYSQRE